MGLDIKLVVPVELDNDEKNYVNVSCIDGSYDPNLCYDIHVTHNLVDMAVAADLYEALWRPYLLFDFDDEPEYPVVIAGDILEKIKSGLKRLEENPEYFTEFNPLNGFGSYDGFVKTVKKYIRLIEAYPNAYIDVWR